MAEEKVVKKNSGAGLRGQSAGETEISTVGIAGNNLRYRGYNVQDLAAHSDFYQVAYLILRGRLPTQTELDRWTKRIKRLRGLPQPLKDVLERIPGNAHPMDVMRTTVSFIGNIEPEGDFSNQLAVAERLLMVTPSALLYWYRYTHDNVRIETETDDDGIGAHRHRRTGHDAHGLARLDLARERPPGQPGSPPLPCLLNQPTRPDDRNRPCVPHVDVARALAPGAIH